ncbi:glycosyltransferase [Zobellia galactanivorans]|uniref:glycosyltransferase n=1 Tax=Zobellia galactanivorans (strain DSM 12802 / CCUG 47099 / CIP 106680 / NCIMB 13871 / Dsij) TaxID=63186 RepID=UPI001C06C9D1|nr:glycosyltransferase [Zobellia galactanivorans]MBU3026688.1 glycosyltransferase [Zobellia galactanivorans]
MKKSVVLLLPSLWGGGSERVFLNLCKHLDKDKFDVTLCLLKKEGEFLSHIGSNPGFQIHDLGVSRVRYSILPIIKYLRKVRPDVVVSTLGHLNALLSAVAFLIPKKVKLIGRESNIVSKSNHNKVTLLLYKFFYKNFDKVVVQSTDMESDLKKLVKNFKKDQVVKINNPVDSESILKAKKTSRTLLPKDKINLISVGSLTHQKGYDILIRSFAKFRNKDRYHITILGRGKLSDELQKLAEVESVDKNVSFIGFKSNPYEYIGQSSIFISSSRFEGFPNVVLEALICDVPVIANSYKGGINEIIDDPIFGKIIDMEKSDVFEKTCEEIALRELPEGRLSKETDQKYGIAAIVKQYEMLILNI